MKDHKGKDGTDKPCLSPKGLKAQKKMKPPDTAGAEINVLSVLKLWCPVKIISETRQQQCVHKNMN